MKTKASYTLLVMVSIVVPRVYAGDLTIEGSLNVTSNLTATSITATNVTAGAIMVQGDISAAGVIRGDASGLTNLNAAIANNSIGTNKAAISEWNAWGDSRYLANYSPDIQLGGSGRIAGGLGADLACISNTAYGAIQLGAFWGTQSISGDAAGAFQQGWNDGDQTIGSWALGAGQRGYNGGSQKIADDGYGASQQGINTSLQEIGYLAAGASQHGWNDGTMIIGTNAVGSEQRGFVAYGALATNSGKGSVQLLNLTNGQVALVAGHASIGLGACKVTNDQAIVAGDGLVSHGRGTITAVGFYGDGSGLTNVMAIVQTNSITSEKLASGSITASKLAVGSITASVIATGAVTAAAIANNSIGTNKAAISEWNAWGDRRYLSAAGGMIDLALGAPGRMVAGEGLNLTNISTSAIGASQRGQNYGVQKIESCATGADQRGLNMDERVIGSESHGSFQAGQNWGVQVICSGNAGASQYGYNNWGGMQVISNDASGASQRGVNYGTQIVGVYAHGALQAGQNDGEQMIEDVAMGAFQVGINIGSQKIGQEACGASQQGVNIGLQQIGCQSAGASQHGWNDGTMIIGTNAFGAEQRGYLAATAVATNLGKGSVQLLNLSDGQVAFVTGHASIGLGASQVTHDQAIVAGDGLTSHGRGTITAVGFYGDGSGLTGVMTPAAATSLVSSITAHLATTQQLSTALATSIQSGEDAKMWCTQYVKNVIENTSVVKINNQTNLLEWTEIRDNELWKYSVSNELFVTFSSDIGSAMGIDTRVQGVTVKHPASYPHYIAGIYGAIEYFEEGNYYCLADDFFGAFFEWNNDVGQWLPMPGLGAGGMGSGLGSGSITLIEIPVTNISVVSLNNIWKNPTCATNWTWINDGHQIELTGYIGVVENNVVMIPSMLDGLPVTAIGDEVFMGRESLEVILGGDNIESIGNRAFANCRNLCKISLPNAVLIGDEAFLGVTNLFAINLPKIKSVGSKTFSFCTGLRSIMFNDDVPVVGSNIFYGIQSNQVTVYVANPTAVGWASTFFGMPVVRMPLYGDGAGLTNLNLKAYSITSDKLAYGSVVSSAIATSAVTSAAIAANSIGTNKAVILEWNSWGDSRYASVTGISDLVVNPGRIIAGRGLNLTNIAQGCLGSGQWGTNSGTLLIKATSYGAIQRGLNVGVGTISSGAHGASQIGYNAGTQTIGLGSTGAFQQGRNTGSQTIGSAARGASQVGANNGIQTIASYADGAEQRGVLASGAFATNSGKGSVQLLNLSSGQVALVTGHASMGLGASQVTNDQAIVAGDGLVSHGNGTVTAVGFYGDGSGVTNLDLASYAGQNIVWNPTNKTLNVTYVINSNDVFAAITAIPSLMDGDDDSHWSGTSNGLDVVAGRAALGLGSAALQSTGDFAPADLSRYTSATIVYSNGQLHATSSITVSDITNVVVSTWPNIDTNKTDNLKTTGGTLTGNLNMGGNAVQNLPDQTQQPPADRDAISKAYLRSVLSCLPPQGNLSMGSYTNGAPAGGFPLTF